MHKPLMIAASLATLGAVAAVQPALAEKKRVCQTSLLLTQQWKRNCSGENSKKNHCDLKLSGPAGMTFQQCFDVDVPPKPTTAWVPGTGYNNSINQLKTRQNF